MPMAGAATAIRQIQMQRSLDGIAFLGSPILPSDAMNLRPEKTHADVDSNTLFVTPENLV
ncbi:MAG: hypothetical protein AAFP90_19690 [Planctomycetota bacterium]